MYSPPYYKQTNETYIHKLIEAYPFATLISAETMPVQVSHLPFLLDKNKGERGTLWGHLARANPQWKHFEEGGELITIFQGPHAYISPAWYQPAPDNVPTWDYAVVHGYGTARMLSSEEAYEGLENMVKLQEGKYQTGWQLQMNDSNRRSLLAPIVAFEIEIERWDAKFKFNQNHGEANIRGVLEGLGNSPLESARDAGRWMRELMEGEGKITK